MPADLLQMAIPQLTQLTITKKPLSAVVSFGLVDRENKNNSTEMKI